MKRKRLALIALVIILIALVALAVVIAPALWEMVIYRSVTRLYFPDGSLRYEYKLKRWEGNRAVTVIALPGEDGELVRRESAALVVFYSMSPHERHVRQAFVFPGNDGTLDFEYTGPKPRTEIEDLQRQRALEYGLTPPPRRQRTTDTAPRSRTHSF